MDNKTTFLQYTDAGRYKKVSDMSEADFVRLSVRDYKTLITENEKLRERYEQLQKQSDDNGEWVMISARELFSYKNALRIIRERAKKQAIQILRAQPDSHGYTLRMADERAYERNFPDLKAFFISRSTPYSLKIDLETVSFMIQKDLEAFYHFIPLQSVVTPSFSKPTTIKVPELLRAIAQRDDPGYNYDFYGDNSNSGRMLKEFVDSLPKAVSFAPIKIGSDIGNGVYTISYWATAPI